MPTALPAPAFLDRRHEAPIFDVRTPAEFEDGHIPGAHNLPLFSNDERAEVGTLYKQESREAAFLRGLEIIGPKMRPLVDEIAAIAPPSKRVLVHCWRGGMRSGSVAHLLEMAGFDVATLTGGYKAFRSYVLETLAHPRPIYVLSGMTGSGKTDVLHALAAHGEQMIDLEGLAHHKGSVFGSLGQPPQPTQQQFENALALEWAALDPDRPVWLEDESRRIGNVSIPMPLWKQLQQAPIFVLDVPRAIRVDRLVADYGDFDFDELVYALSLIERRLGGARTKAAREAAAAGDFSAACALSLAYYDSAYTHTFRRRPDATLIDVACDDPASPEALAEAVLDRARQTAPSY